MTKLGLACGFLLVSLVHVSMASGQNWNLVWADEFDVDGLIDTSKWSYQVGASGWGNQELQYYTEERSENVRVLNGRLIIEARHEPFGGADYTSGRIRTIGLGDWLYGRIEVRAKLPAGRGTWPAIWMLATDSPYGSWPAMGEIDIMEAVGHEPGRTNSAIHTGGLNHQLGNNPFATLPVPTSATEFHTYAVDWTPNRITTYVDDDISLIFNRNGGDWQRWPFDNAFHLLLNIAVGGTWGGAQGVDPAAFPTRMEVDYVRVYEDLDGPPQVSFSETTADTLRLAPGSSFSIEALAVDPNSTIESLGIFQQDGLLMSVRDGTVTANLADLYPGCYKLRAVAIDNDGWEGRSDTLHVKVGDTCGRAPYLMTPHPIPGRIQAEYYDLGGPGVAYQELTLSNTGGAIRLGEAVDIGPSLDAGGGYRVENVTRREWMEYTVRIEHSGTYRLLTRVASLSDGAFTLSMDSVDLPEPVAYRSTGSESFYRNAVLDDIQLEAGVRTMRLSFDGIGTLLNWLEFQLVSVTNTEPDAVAGQPSVEVFPNPFSGSFHVDLSGFGAERVEMALHDTLGRTIWRKTVVPNSGPIGFEVEGISRLARGAYVLRVRQGTTEWTHVVIAR